MYARNDFEEMVLKTFRGITATAPLKVYIGLFIENPGEAGEGTEITYPTYKRQEIAFSAPAVSVSDYGSGAVGIKNTIKIVFPKPEQAVGTATHIGIFDSIVGGKMYLYGKLTDQLVINANQSPQILEGDIKFWSTGKFSNAFKTKVLNFFRGQNISGFSPHLALYNGDPQSGGAELSGANYARAKVVFGEPQEAESGQMTIRTSQSTEFNIPTTTWGIWAYNAYFDAVSGGELVMYDPAATPEKINRGYAPYADPGDIEVSFN